MKDETKRLTLTWDVLKWELKEVTGRIAGRLTLTWDVLKFLFLKSYKTFKMININMRCIEIRWKLLIYWG